ncbi:MAG TPA: ATP-binding cassette domain-containing protein [Thermoanaerobaculia bacterium]|nr:ATP-binding cassette domain-containing protein [Thermoanaerobaculia bacterium]
MTLSLEGLRLPLTPFAVELDATLSAHVTAVFGPSGAGKTSLLEAVAGLRRPDRGRIVLSGRVLDDTAAGVRVPPRQRAVGYVTQDDSLFPHLSVSGNLRYGAGRGAARKAPLGEDRIVETLGLATLLDRRPATLSGGERRRVALGRALLSAPEILLLDEPLSGLDRPLKERVLEHLQKIKAAFPLPILYVTHEAAEVAALSDEVVVLEHGRIAGRGRPAELLGLGV